MFSADFASRLKAIRKKLKLTQQGLADSLSEKQTKIKDIETSKQRVSPEFAYKVEKLYNIDFKWLLTGEGDMFRGKMDEDYIEIPVFCEVECSTDPCCYIDNKHPTDYINMSKTLLKQINANITTSHIIKVRGDSMEPVILDRDKVLADSSKKQLLNNKIYIIRVEDTLMVKRLQKLPKGIINVISENKKYNSYTLKPDEDNYEVCAQVLWLSRDMN